MKKTPTELKKCGSNLRKKPGKTCQRLAEKGKRRCYLHGAKALSGTAHPRYKHGRYSQYMVKDFKKRYLEHSSDQRSNDLNDEIALMTAHIGDLIQAVEAKGPAESFPSMQKVLREFNQAMEQGHIDRMKELLATLNETVNQGMVDGMVRSELWDKITERVEARRKLVDTQRKYDIDMGRMLPVKQAHQYMVTLATIVKDAVDKYIEDPLLARSVLASINRQFHAIFSGPVRELPPPDSGS